MVVMMVIVVMLNMTMMMTMMMRMMEMMMIMMIMMVVKHCVVTTVLSHPLSILSLFSASDKAIQFSWSIMAAMDAIQGTVSVLLAPPPLDLL